MAFMLNIIEDMHLAPLFTEHGPDTRYVINKSNECGCQRLAVVSLIEDKKSKMKKGHNSEKMHFELSPLIVWIALWAVNTYSEFQENIFNNNRKT